MSRIETREIRFLLDHVAGLPMLLQHPRYAHLQPGMLDDVFDTAAKLAERYFLPHNRSADLDEPHLADGKVRLIPEVRQACAAFAESGLLRAHLSEGEGGLQLPWCASSAAMTYFQAANIATLAYLTLTLGAANLLHAFGTPQQKQRYMQPLFDGRWFGTMALSEPQAGSSLADIRTRATPNEDGSYSIVGTKQWISGGEHELGENIVHLVLARIRDAPAGVQGISLFIVPRHRVHDDGSIGEPNDVRLVSLLHKMGYRGITSTILAFGTDDACQGFLVGEPNRGLSCMFHMMNEARIGVGLGAASLGYAGYRYSLEYARTRRQGRLPDSKDPGQPMTPIINHPDVRHMLLSQKVQAEGGLALCLYCASLLDRRATAEDAAQARDLDLLLDLLTPVAKAWPSDFCLDANRLAIQILGGYGYTRDYPVEQYYRDNRLNAIHEGTNGIQALDLLGRKLRQANGRGLDLLLARMDDTIAAAHAQPALRGLGDAMRAAAGRLSDTSASLARLGASAGTNAMLTNASAHLTLFGHTVVAWLWLVQAEAAARLQPGAPNADMAAYYAGKLAACRYFFRWELPRTEPLAAALRAGDTEVLSLETAGL